MRRIGIIAVLSLLVTAFAAVPALAVTNFANAPTGAHYVTGFGEPVCTLDPATNTVTCTETQIAGVGNTTATTALTITATATVLCSNPSGKVVEPHTTQFSETVSSGILEPEHGRLRVAPVTATVTEADLAPEEFTCPNPNWSEDVTDVTVTGFTYTLTFTGFAQPAITITG